MYWLLGATEGHAKNFSIRLAPGGRFRLTPLYDILSAEPSLAAGQINRNQMKLAMAVGTNRRVVVHTIVARHFLQTAKRCGLRKTMAREILQELADSAAASLDKTLSALLAGFPEEIVSPIVDAFRQRLGHLASAASGI